MKTLKPGVNGCNFGNNIGEVIKLTSSNRNTLKQQGSQ